MTLGEALAGREQELGVSANKGALHCDVTRNTYDAWKAGKRPPKPRHWPAIAEFLGCSVGRVAVYIGVLSESELVEFVAKRTLPKTSPDQRKVAVA